MFQIMCTRLDGIRSETCCMVKAGDVWVKEDDIILVERDSKLVYVPKRGIPHKYEFKID